MTLQFQLVTLILKAEVSQIYPLFLLGFGLLLLVAIVLLVEQALQLLRFLNCVFSFSSCIVRLYGFAHQ